MILKGLKKKLDDAKGLWVELLHEILWTYNVTPYSTTGEFPFVVVYGADIVLLVEINTPSWRRSQFNEEANKVGLKCSSDLVDELREVAHIREFATKHMVIIRYNSKVKPREKQEGDLVLKEMVLPAQ